MANKYECQICSAAPHKYRCSACHVLYCSVTCYKVHKSSSCNGTGQESDAKSESSLVGHGTVPATTVPSSSALRPLSELNWPLEPERTAFADPLSRDEPRPLTHSQYLSIATSPKLRSMLRDNPRLPTILRSIDSLRPDASREHALELVLGVGVGRIEPIRTVENDYMDEEDMHLTRQFAEEVEKAVRSRTELGLDWEDSPVHLTN